MLVKSLFLSVPAFILLGWYYRNTASVAETPLPQATATISNNNCPDNPEELGNVCWLRQLDSAQVISKATAKPILILFQEVPGCSNCTRFGASTLSHPLIVEAMEDLFVPLCIYNNKKGSDAAALAQFGEPAWNNPVIRIVDDKGKDLTTRMPDFRSGWETVHGMVSALKAAGKTAPTYLQLLDQELQSRENGLDTATFSMYCFWSGEGTFGAINGVVETASGFQNGKEVVKVQFNPNVISKVDLERIATPKDITTCKSNKGFRADSEPKYYLSSTLWKYVPMTSLQACRANNLVGKNAPPDEVLSPRQITLYEHIKKAAGKGFPNAIGKHDLVKAWADAH